MRILIDAREYTTSTGRYMFRLLQYLDRLDTQQPAGHDYHILLKPTDMAVYTYTSPRFTKIACPYKEFSFGEQLGLLKQISGLKPDLVHFGKDHQPLLFRGPVVTTMHDLTTARFRNPAKPWLVFKTKQLIYRQLVQVVARKSQAILTPTQFVKDDIVRFTHIHPDKITVTYEAADAITDPPQELPELVGNRFIMYVGRPTPHKNLGRLIESYRELQKTMPDLYLVLAGKRDANYDRYSEQAQAKHLKNVIFTGFVSEGQLRWLYEHCAAYIYPSLSEGFGLPGVEAMIHGAPVVSSRATCLPEVYGDAAAYFDPLQIKDMAHTIGAVLQDERRRANMIATGRVQAARYSWLRMAEQTLAVYNRVGTENNTKTSREIPVLEG